jgi:hypothetical protein
MVAVTQEIADGRLLSWMPHHLPAYRRGMEESTGCDRRSESSTSNSDASSRPHSTLEATEDVVRVHR